MTHLHDIRFVCTSCHNSIETGSFGDISPTVAGLGGHESPVVDRDTSLCIGGSNKAPGPNNMNVDLAKCDQGFVDLVQTYKLDKACLDELLVREVLSEESSEDEALGEEVLFTKLDSVREARLVRSVSAESWESPLGPPHSRGHRVGNDDYKKNANKNKKGKFEKEIKIANSKKRTKNTKSPTIIQEISPQEQFDPEDVILPNDIQDEIRALLHQRASDSNRAKQLSENERRKYQRIRDLEVKSRAWHNTTRQFRTSMKMKNEFEDFDFDRAWNHRARRAFAESKFRANDFIHGLSDYVTDSLEESEFDKEGVRKVVDVVADIVGLSYVFLYGDRVMKVFVVKWTCDKYPKIRKEVVKLLEKCLDMVSPMSEDFDIFDVPNFLSKVLAGPLFGAISRVIVSMAALKFFSLDVYPHITKLLGKAEDRTVLGLVKSVLECLKVIIMSGRLIASGVPMSEALLGVNPVADVQAKIVKLLAFQNMLYSGLPSDWKMDRSDYIAQGRSNCREADLILRTMSARSDGYQSLLTATNRLKQSVATQMSIHRSGIERALPVGIVLVGRPRIGKSRLRNYICAVYGHVKGVPFTTSQVYCKNQMDDYWEGYDTYETKYIQFPEMGMLSAKILQSKGDQFVLVTNAIMDTGPAHANMAFEDKGKMMLDPWMLMIDTNNPTLGASHVVTNPAAVLARFLFIKPTVKEEFQGPDGILDKDKSRRSDQKSMDRWYFDVYVRHAINNQDTREVMLLQHADIYALTEFLQKYFTDHIAHNEFMQATADQSVDITPYLPEIMKDVKLDESKEDNYFSPHADDFAGHEDVVEYEELRATVWHKMGDHFRGVKRSIKRLFEPEVVVDQCAHRVSDMFDVEEIVELDIDDLLAEEKKALSEAWFSRTKKDAQMSSDPEVQEVIIVDDLEPTLRDKVEVKWRQFSEFIYVGVACVSLSALQAGYLFSVGVFSAICACLPNGMSVFKVYFAAKRAAAKAGSRWCEEVRGYCVAGFLSKGRECFKLLEAKWLLPVLGAVGLVLAGSIFMRKRSNQRRPRPNEEREVHGSYVSKYHMGGSIPRVKPKIGKTWNDRYPPVPVHCAHTGSAHTLVRKVNRNLRCCVFSHELGSSCSYVLGVSGNFALVNSHSTRNLPCKVEYALSTAPESVRASFFLTKDDVVRLGHDVSLIQMPCSFVDILKHLTNAEHVSLKTKACIGDDDIQIEYKSEELLDPVIGTALQASYQYYWREHGRGMCGLPVVAQFPSGAGVVGIHTFHLGGDMCACSPLLREEVVRGIESLSSRCGLMKIHSESESLGTGLEDPIPKSMFHHEELTGLRYLGRYPRKVMVNKKSRVVRTPNWRAVDDFFSGIGLRRTTEFAPPQMDIKYTPYVNPWNLNVKKMSCPIVGLDRTLLKKIVSEIVDKLAPCLPQASPLNLNTALNGDVYDAFLRRVNLSTSAGFPWPGYKRDYTTVIDEAGNVDLQDDVVCEVERGIDTYASGVCCHFPMKMDLKDEARLVEKVRAGKTRGFCIGSQVHLYISRMFLAPFYTSLVQHGREIGVMVGIDMHTEADVLMKFIKGKVFQGDYGSYDQTMPFDIGWAACSVIEQCLQRMGYNNDALQVVRGLLTDALFPVIDVLTDQFVRPGYQPSGKYGTAEDNSLKGLILCMYSWYQQTDLPYFDNTHIFFYGDDVCGSVEDDVWHLFNAKIHSDNCARLFGMEFTAATKGIISQEFEGVECMSFLKRSFWYSDEYGRWFAKLDHNSIIRSLQWYIPSKAVYFHEQMRGTYSAAIMELFFHDPQRAEEFNTQLSKIYSELTDRPFELLVNIPEFVSDLGFPLGYSRSLDLFREMKESEPEAQQ